MPWHSFVHILGTKWMTVPLTPLPVTPKEPSRWTNQRQTQAP